MVALGAGCRPAPQRSNETRASGEVPSLTALDAITLERRPCYGGCAFYRVTITGEGSVTFEGIRNVDSLGVRAARVNADSAAKLFQFADSIAFHDFAERYVHGETGCTPYIADLPGAIVTLVSSGRTKRVESDPGCPSVPRRLAELHALIDRTAGVERWAGRR